MKVWIVKNVLEEGIRESPDGVLTKATDIFGKLNAIEVFEISANKKGGINLPIYLYSDEFELTKEKAIEKAKEMQKYEVEKLERRLKKVKEIKFEL